MGIWPQINIELPEGYSRCFGCGNDNPIGLKLRFEKTDSGVVASFTAKEQYQGWPGFLHGGIAACLLDEAMSYAALFAGERSLTAKMEMRLKKLIPINEPLTIAGMVTKKTRKVIECSATIALQDGTVVAESTAKQFVINAGSDRILGGET